MTRKAGATAAAAAVFVITWSAIHLGALGQGQIRDTPRYESWGSAVVDGRVPYRDLAIEYPPGALAPIVAPAAAVRGIGSRYEVWFEALMLACGIGMLIAVARLLDSVALDRRDAAARLAFVSALPLLTGTVILSRFDLWPTALAAAGIAAVVGGAPIVAGGLLGIGAAAKIFPVLYVPLALTMFASRSRRAAIQLTAAFAVTFSAVIVPFLVIAPHGLTESFRGQASRPLQIETLGASLALAAHQLYGQPLGLDFSHHSQNLGGGTAAAIAGAQVVLEAVALVAILVAFMRGAKSRERFLRYAAAVTLAFVVFGKVLSPQYLIWVAPLVAVVPGRRGRRAMFLVALALIATQVWFPHRYWRLVLHFDALASWALLFRNLLLVAALALLILPRGRLARFLA